MEITVKNALRGSPSPKSKTELSLVNLYGRPEYWCLRRVQHMAQDGCLCFNAYSTMHGYVRLGLISRRSPCLL